MQHVSANKWPEAARIKTKNHIWLHSVKFRVCSANFRVCSANFRVCFWRDCVQKMECSNSPINTAAKICHRLLKAFNHPTNSRWAQATMPHYKILWWDVSWSSDTCGNSGANDSSPLYKSYFFPCFMTAQTAEQANNAQRTQNMKISKNVFVSENVSKNVFVWKNTSFQCFPNKYPKKKHIYGCLGRANSGLTSN